MNIEKIFDYARENNISDIHLLEGEKIYFRKNGEITDLETAKKVMALYDALEDLDDSQNVYSNFDIPDEILEQLD